MNLIMASHFTETRIYVKLDRTAAHCYCTLLSSKDWYHLLKMELRQTLKIMENQGSENKNRNKKFHFHEFIHFIAYLIGS